MWDMSVKIYQTTRRNIPEDNTIQNCFVYFEFIFQQRTSGIFTTQQKPNEYSEIQEESEHWTTAGHCVPSKGPFVLHIHIMVPNATDIRKVKPVGSWET
jgi:hypothetical protein